MQKCISKASSQFDYFELDNDCLFELWANTTSKKYYVKGGLCHLGFPTIMKCFIWKQQPDNTFAKVKADIGDYIMLCEDKSVTIVKAENIGSWNELIMPFIDGNYTFLKPI